MLNVNGKPVGETSRPYIIAEMACAHNGKKDYALKLVDLAVEAKADAVQLQIFDIDEMIVSTHEVYDTIKDIEFSKDDWREIVSYVRQFTIDLMICAYDIKSLEFAIELGADGIKFNSADLLNIEMLQRVAEAKIPFTLHTGASSIEEISYAVDFVTKMECGQLILMHGVQNFPTDTANADIGRVRLLKNLFNLPTGYDDHTDAETDEAHFIDLVALGMGADILEKHITLSRAEKGIDYVSALEADEFKSYVERIKNMSKAVGNFKIKPFNESDLKYRKFQKKSIVAIKDLKKGDVVNKEDIKFLRNAVLGLQPNEASAIIGKKLVKDIYKYDNILKSDIE